MKGIYKSLDTYKDLKLGWNRSVRVHRLRLGAYIEYIVLRRVYRAADMVNAFDKMIEIMAEIIEVTNTQGKGAIRRKDYAAVLDAIDKINGLDKKGQGDKDHDPDRVESWLDDTIAFFGVLCGWTKRDVLDLFPDEISPLVEGVVRHRKKLSYLDADNIFPAVMCGVNSPDKYKEICEGREKKESGVASAELEKIKKMEAEWLGKHYGDIQ